MYADPHEPTAGGWRRAAIGLLVGAGFGVLVRIVVGAPAAGH